MTEENVEFVDPDTGEREDVTPGEAVPSDLYFPVDEDYDYEEASETWIGEGARTELRIENVDGSQVKRFLLTEPGDEEVTQCIHAVLTDREYPFCEAIVEEPELTKDRWIGRLTGKERKLLYDHCFAWVDFGEFVTMQQVIDEIQ